MSRRLEGKVAVVTGSGGPGMGRAAAIRFAQEGALVAGCDVNEAGARETARLVEQAGGRMVSLQPLDLREESAAETLMAAAEQAFGPIDILYNNAAWARFNFPLALAREDLEHTLEGCILSAWMCAKHAVPRMRRGGSVINVASIAGMPGGTAALGNNAIFFSYCIGKAGLIRMTELLAIELGPREIRANSISPGITLPIARGVVGDEGSPTRKAWEDGLLVKRPALPEDVAGAAVFLASDEASYITGHNLVVDGGWSVSGGKGWPTQEGFDLMNAPAGWFRGLAPAGPG